MWQERDHGGGMARAALLIFLLGFLGTVLAARRIEPLGGLVHDLNHALLGIADHPERVAAPQLVGPMPATPVAVRMLPSPAPPPLRNPSYPFVRVVLPAGVSGFDYRGPAQPLGVLLAPIAGKYRSAWFRAPDGQILHYAPGISGDEHAMVPSGVTVSLHMIEAATLDVPWQ